VIQAVRRHGAEESARQVHGAGESGCRRRRGRWEDEDEINEEREEEGICPF
jgi:hypothetical protein